MPPPQFEVELVNARHLFYEALEKSAHVQEAGERYGALLSQYLEKMRKHVKGSVVRHSYNQSSLGTAAQLDYASTIKWAIAEQERVSEAIRDSKAKTEKALRKRESRK